MMPENIEKAMYLKRDEQKAHYYDAQKIEIFQIFNLKSSYYAARKY